MATINEIVASIEVELEAARKRRLKAQEELKLTLEQARQEGRTGLSEDERSRMDQLWNVIETSKSQVESIRVKLENARRIKKVEDESDAAAAIPSSDPKPSLPAYDQVARVTREERTYTPESDPSGRVFLQDVARQFVYRDVQATNRLSRHMQEERVERASQLTRTAGDLTTAASGSGAGGLIVPQYLVDMVAPHIANLRPFADICNKHILPAEGMSLTVPTITTATSVTAQSSELADAAAQSLVETDLTIAVKTASGRQNVSRQAIERGTGVEDVVLQDLFAQYATNLDSQLITDTTTGLYDVATGVSYTDSDPTAPELYPVILKAAAAVEAALLAKGQPSHVLMHSRRWYWMSAEMTSTWPFLSQPGIDPRVAGDNAGVGYGQGVRGRLPNGLDVVVDNNIPILCTGGAKTGGDEDTIFVISNREAHLWEEAGAPAFIRAEQPLAANLGIQLVVYGFFAYTFKRYANAVQNIEGTGLSAATMW